MAELLRRKPPNPWYADVAAAWYANAQPREGNAAGRGRLFSPLLRGL
jgi:hypothetical protein